jgi:hypothetical protein
VLALARWVRVRKPIAGARQDNTMPSIAHRQRGNPLQFAMRVAVYVPLDVGREDQDCPKSRINLGCQGRCTQREHRVWWVQIERR